MNLVHTKGAKSDSFFCTAHLIARSCRVRSSNLPNCYEFFVDDDCGASINEQQPWVAELFQNVHGNHFILIHFSKKYFILRLQSNLHFIFDNAI